MIPPYEIIKSRRKTICIEVSKDGVLVRAPHRVSKKEIHEFVVSREAWIEKMQLKVKKEESKEPVHKLTKEEMEDLSEQALFYIPGRVEYYAGIMGVEYGRVTLRFQRTRWGSCSSKGNLNFNSLLMLTPPEVIDSVVVHELCHRKHMNHSEAFYKDVLKVYPDYRKWNTWLRKNGKKLIEKI